MARGADTTGQMIRAGILAWILPGLGHWVLGHRALGLVFFLAISIPYALGLAIGGLKNSVNPWANPWLFLAEMGTGGYTTVGALVNNRVGLKPELLKDPHYLSTLPDAELQRVLPYISFSPDYDVAQIYLATAGLLNLLAILDALTRAQTGGLPTYYRELAPTAESPGGKP